MQDTPVYDQVLKDLKVDPLKQQGHDARVEVLEQKHRSRMVKPDGSISPARRVRTR